MKKYNTADEDTLEQGFSNYGSRNEFKINWLYSSDSKPFVTLTKKLKVDL